MDFGFILSSAAGELFSPTTAAYALAALGLAVHFGYSGLLNFGQAGFMAVGAYGFAISTLSFGVPFFVGLLIAVVCSVLFALMLGIPTLRLRADYLAIVTIAAAEIVRYVVTTNQLTAVTGSANGLAAFEGGFYAMNPFPEGSYLGMNNRDFFIRVIGWGLVDRLLRHCLAADAQPLGPCPEGHPRGRERGPLARQERVRLQDAGAGHRRHPRARWPAWCLRSPAARSSPPTTAPS